MILSDNETKIDMLNNKAIAKTVVEVIRECDDRPISIGIHGDWGAGKSSILVMVEDELNSKVNKNNSVVCIRFNGWQHQGFEDAKIALMSAALDSIGKYMTDSKVFEDTSLTKEFAEFQSSFETLLKESKIQKLVVLIDDLDRCLPKVTIETLEAVRLFMFTKYTAFVIAADEAMIEYAVHNHFPNLPDEAGSKYDYSKRYLEKLIQVPFKIPALGEVESEMYVTLLMISSQIKENDKEFDALLSATIEKMKKPWENTGLSTEDLRNSLNTKYDTVSNEIAVANQISDILARNTQGNPRKIKRFLNMLLLRKQMAEARGFGESVLIPILAKLMLAEYYFPNQYKEIATLTDDDGKCPLLDEFRKLLTKSEQPAEPEVPNIAMAVSREKPMPEPPKLDKHIEDWRKDKDFSKWVASEPALGNIDLRPYFFASKEREDYFFEQIKSEKLRELVSKLMSTSMVIASANEEIKNLTQEEAKRVYDQVTIKTKKALDISKQPNGIDGIRTLVELHKELETALITFIESFPVKTVGAWICTGWDKSITTEASNIRLREYITKLKTDGQGFTKVAANAALK